MEVSLPLFQLVPLLLIVKHLMPGGKNWDHKEGEEEFETRERSKVVIVAMLMEQVVWTLTYIFEQKEGSCNP